jgi:mono/diheme cytochrome c family protein
VSSTGKTACRFTGWRVGANRLGWNAVLLWLCALAPISLATAETADWQSTQTPRDGHALFTGQGTGVFERQGCHTCHSRDGQGGNEGSAPDLIKALLKYDSTSLQRVLRDGIAPDGRLLTRLMPRFSATIDESRALLDYLSTLPQRERRGVTGGSVAICLWAETEAARAYASIVEKAFTRRLAGDHLHGRVIEFHAANSASDTACLAITGLPSSPEELDSATRAGLPVLYPPVTVEGGEDPSILRTLGPSSRALAAALAKDFRTRSIARIRIWGTPVDGLINALRFEMPGLQIADDPAAAVLAFDPLPARVDQNTLIYLFPTALRRDVPPPRRAVLVIDRVALLAYAQETAQSPLEAHADLAATAIVAGLITAGRDLTRTGLLRALRDVRVPGHDFQKHLLTGTDAVSLLLLTNEGEPLPSEGKRWGGRPPAASMCYGGGC